MRLREFVLLSALLPPTLCTVKAMPETRTNDELRSPAISETASGGTNRESATTSLPMPPSQLMIKDKALSSAYYDTLSILLDGNKCSDFFGGSAGAVEVFNKLMENIVTDHVRESVGMRMFGHSTNVLNTQTKMRYRLFEKVAINSNGPFYRQKMGPASPNIPRMGTFRPNSREVRVLMFLHELGHLMKGRDGNWLLSDDGHDDALSSSNSGQIETVCGNQIRETTRSEPGSELIKKRRSEGLLAAHGVKSATQN